jgi:hypothetical protein
MAPSEKFPESFDRNVDILKIDAVFVIELGLRHDPDGEHGADRLGISHPNRKKRWAVKSVCAKMNSAQ